MKNSPIVIIGHKGKTGARVEQRLKALNIPTRGISRSTTPAFDWEKPDTWVKALEGARAAYITYQPDLAVPHAEADMHTLVRAAKQAGVEHLVLLSGRGEEGAQKAEAVLQNSGLAWNVVRASWFMQNFSESFMLDGIMSGTLALPADTVLEPFVDLDDVAEVVTALLIQDELRNQLVEVSGPEAITFANCVDIIAKACNREIHFLPIHIDTFLAELQKQGAPDALQWLMKELFTKVLDGRNAAVTTGISDILERPATSFQDYAKQVAQSGIWNCDSQQKIA